MANSRYFTVPGSERTYDRNKLLGVLLIPLAMALLQVSSVDNLLPAIQSGLGASSSSIQWVLSGYALAVGILLVPSGRLGDVFGRSGMFTIGLAVFAAGSLACGLSSNPSVLNAMRIFQGIGAGIYSPQVTGLIQQYFVGRDKARAFGFMGLVIAMSVAAGPVMSGSFVAWLGDENGWRWSFIINAPLGIAGLICAAHFLPFGKERRHVGQRAMATDTEYADEEATSGHPTSGRRGEKIDLDPLGMIVLCLAVLCVMLPFMIEQSWRWFLLLGGVILAVVWLIWERSYKARGHIPMVNLDLFKLESFSFSVAITGFQFLGTTSIFVILSMYLQNGVGASALAVGLVSLSNALSSAFSAMWSGRHSLEHGRAIQVGALAVIAGASLLVIASAWGISRGGSLWLMVPSLVILGLGMGCMGAANQTVAMLDVPLAHGGTAGGVYQTTQRVTTAIGNALVTAIFFALSAGAQTGTTKGDHQWFVAFAAGMCVIVAIVLCALTVATMSYRRAKKRQISPHAADVAAVVEK
ncbi:MFS transporter [Arcanobacterium haemolyticum]|nr:MFS transporter [Arcanobacterium haemolyticum]